jgi:uncharacterized phiE125 gp8 family phage protein
LAEPITLAEAKAQVRMVEDDSEDTFLESLIAPARALCERYTGWTVVARTVTESFGAWGDFIELTRRPITSVTTVAYVDEAGTDATYEGFLATLGRYPLRIYPGIDESFPTLGTGGAITVTYAVGAMASTSDEYLLIKRAILLIIGHWFENRESVVIGDVANEVPMAARWMLDELRPISAY